MEFPSPALNNSSNNSSQPIISALKSFNLAGIISILLLFILLTTTVSAQTKYWLDDNANLSIDVDNVLFVDMSKKQSFFEHAQKPQVVFDTTNNGVGIG